ncbi:MAG TPA: nuclear transport factor 2 family protein [Candidatus Angelobacter sp.]
MRILAGCVTLFLVLASAAWSQKPSPKGVSNQKKSPATSSASAQLTEMFTSKVTIEWDAFKKKDKKSYSDLLADDFAAVEDDNQGMRTKSTAAAEVDRSVVNNYHLFALKVIPLGPNAALITYELTLEFPTKAAVRFKRVLVSELWLKRNGQWKERYYQETHVR